MYKIKLSKCAYIFDNSSTTYKLTRQQAEEDGKKQKILKAFYDNEERRAEWIPATKKTITLYDGTQFDRIQIELDGVAFNLNALQIKETSEPQEIYNNKKIVDLSNFNSSKFTEPKHQRVYSKKYKSLEFENFTQINNLGYFRVNFNNISYSFIIDNKNNYYTAHGVIYAPITKNNIVDRLGIKSKAAKLELLEIFNYIESDQATANGAAIIGG